MGGNAFTSATVVAAEPGRTLLSNASFPRIPPAVYRALKARLVPALEELFEHVDVPKEAPEKLDYGDLDITVVGLKAAIDPDSKPTDLVSKAIGAVYCVAMSGNRTSNYAIRVEEGEWMSLGHSEEEDMCRAALEVGVKDLFYQVDVHPCEDNAEFDRILFFNSYGDLGMILGLLTRSAGLRLGKNGLKLPSENAQPPFDLSADFDDIQRFLGLDIERRNRGFATKAAIFEWVAGSRFFHASSFKGSSSTSTNDSAPQGLSDTHVAAAHKKVKPHRTMYAQFIDWCGEREDTSSMSSEEKAVWRESIKLDALVYFKRKEEYEALQQIRVNRELLKQHFSGPIVREWTRLGGNWKGVKLIMDKVRADYGGEEGILKLVHERGVEGLKEVVISAKRELGL